MLGSESVHPQIHLCKLSLLFLIKQGMLTQLAGFLWVWPVGDIGLRVEGGGCFTPSHWFPSDTSALDPASTGRPQLLAC